MATQDDILNEIMLEIATIAEALSDEEDLQKCGKLNRVLEAGDLRPLNEKIYDSLVKLDELLENSLLTSYQKIEFRYLLDRIIKSDLESRGLI
jgi:hypothetical protein